MAADKIREHPRHAVLHPQLRERVAARLRRVVERPEPRRHHVRLRVPPGVCRQHHRRQLPVVSEEIQPLDIREGSVEEERLRRPRLGCLVHHEGADLVQGGDVRVAAGRGEAAEGAEGHDDHGAAVGALGVGALRTAGHWGVYVGASCAGCFAG